MKVYFFSKINIYNIYVLTCTFIFGSYILEFIYQTIIVMSFVYLFISYVIFTLRNVKYQINTKYSNNIVTLN